MRVVHISSKDIVGGAGRAAYRLHRALIAAGHDSAMMVGRKHSRDATVMEVAQTNGFASYSRDFARRNYINLRRTAISNTYFSLAWPGTDLAAHPLVREADVIHLHWVWDFQSAASLGKLMDLGKPVVWSFHDQRAFTGGCHFSAGCCRYETDCATCPQLASDPAGLTAAAHADQALLWNRSAVTAVGLSHWMADCARKSAIWRGSRIEVIPNSVETGVFHPQDRRECRRRLGLPEDAVCVLFGADHGKEIRKGFDLLMRALALCSEDPWFAGRLQKAEICFFCFGLADTNAAQKTVPIRSLGYLKRDEDLADAYGAADLFVLPSLEDNLPNTVLESMACGRPVLALDAGGTRDMLIEGRTGWLVAPCSPEALAARLLSLLREPAIAEGLSGFCREHVLGNFSQDLQARRFCDLYADLLRHPTVARTAEPLAETEAAAGLDCGPGLRAAMPLVFSHAAADLASQPLAKSACKRGYFRFRAVLDAALNDSGTYTDLLTALQLAYREGSKRSSRWEWYRMISMAWLRNVFRKGGRK